MTFFLNAPEAPPIKRTNPDPNIEGGFFGGLGAGTSVVDLERDANFVAHRRKIRVKDDLAKQVVPRLGMDQIRPIIEERNARAKAAGMPSQIVEIPDNVEDAVELLGPNFSQKAIELARDAASLDPEAWADIDLTDEGIDTSTNEILQAEYEDAQAILEMMPDWQGTTRLVGGFISTIKDVRNLPFMLMGGGGSIARIMMREAAINVAAEAAFMPAQFEMADRLQIPDPSVATQLTMAAGFGAVFGGGIAATSRGITYYRGRNRLRSTDMRGYDDIKANALVDQTEDILTSDTPQAFAQVERMMDENPPVPRDPPELPFLLENPINPERPPLVPDRITTTPLDPVDGGPREPLSDANLIESMTAAIDEAKAADSRVTRPLVHALSRNHLVNKSTAKAAEKAGLPVPTPGEDMRVNPEGMVGQELKSRGVTSKTNPGLFSKQGRKDLDNLSAREWEEDYPGIMEATGTEPGALYLDRDGLIDVLVRDAEGDSSWLRSRAEVNRLENELAELQDRGSHGDHLSRPDPEETDQLYIDKDAFLFDVSEDEARANIEATVRGWMDERGYTDALSDLEQREIIDQLQESGGNLDYLVERAFERETDFHEARNVDSSAEDSPFGEAARPDQQGSGRSGDDAGQARGGRAGQEGRAADARQSESTDAGEQTLIDGVAPVTQRQRLEAAQAAPLRGGDAAADDGLFDTGARAQTDMFSDPASPEAKVIHDSVADDLRTQIEKDGPSEVNVEAEDGRVLKTDQEVLDYLDEGDAFSNRIDLCGKGPA